MPFELDNPIEVQAKTFTHAYNTRIILDIAKPTNSSEIIANDWKIRASWVIQPYNIGQDGVIDYDGSRKQIVVEKDLLSHAQEIPEVLAAMAAVQIAVEKVTKKLGKG